MKKPFLLLLCILIFTSCSKEFSREHAKQLIESEFNYPYVEFNDVRFYNKRLTSDGKYIINKTNIKELVDKGILGFREVLDRGTFSSTTKYYYNLKSKGEKLKKPGSKLTNSNGLVYGFFPIHLIEFDGITGIKFNNPEKSSATITYKIKFVEKTPFRKMSGYNLNNLKTDLEINAELFDDGWRLSDNNIGNNLISLSEFPAWEILESTSKTISNSKNIDSENKFDISSILTNETTKYDCYIRKVYKKEDYQLIEVDFVQIKAIEEDGMESYKIVNTNPKLRTFLINENSKLQPSLEFGDLSKYQTKNDDGQLFIIKTKNGIVSSLTRNDAG